MMKTTVILDRRNKNLWVAINDDRVTVVWGIDGVTKEGDQGYYRMMRKGRQVGIVWDVDEVREEW